MGTFTEYNNHFLNHVELLHRSGEGQLAALLFETLGCTVLDVTKEFGARSTYLAVFAEASELDRLNNVLYVSEIGESQLQLEDVLRRRMQADDELRVALEQNDLVRKKPGHVAHFGLRYPDLDELKTVLDRLEHKLPAELAGRVTVYPPFPVGLRSLGTEVHQAFLYTDVIGPGFYPFGQLIELQAQQPLKD
ncbi:hypothetical protein [Pseudofrankia sp. BMG5.36]|uniref:hypothetical protein n=1 Tax=Pseudofrankia sp. BMG5.36 TaxID=1834512 RepID=UPI0008D9BADB|nr:hypothetical protein [Pseudofrankia sp. BMG5.36]OHV43532.1 hypothetical protein BCD48_27520 [Pseudofrankia sp. BMG5.36]